MTEALEFLVRGALIGVGGAAVMDLWALLARRAFNVQGLDYALLGRWIGHFPRGRFVHGRIASADPVRGERPLGWAAHYSIGIAFALVLLGIWGPEWAQAPTIGPALVIGLGTIVAPWCVMQPALGMGIAASRMPSPGSVRVRNIATHAAYGVGLYASALVLAIVWH